MLLSPILIRSAGAVWLSWFVAILLFGPFAHWREQLIGAGPDPLDAGPPSLAGSMLVAADDMDDPTFAGTRIVMIVHDADGAVGLIVNRPLFTSADDPPIALSNGGPVEQDRVIALVDSHAAPDDALVVMDGVRVLTDPEALSDEGVRAHARIFVGYAGWGPGQLERELRMGAWRIERAAVAEVMGAPHDPTGPIRR